MLRRRAIFRLDCHVGAGNRRFGVARFGQMPVLFRNFGSVLLGQPFGPEGRGGFAFRIADLHLVGRFARQLECVGNYNGDDLAAELNFRTEALD